MNKPPVIKPLSSKLSRREFLKVCSLGMAGFFLPDGLTDHFNDVRPIPGSNRLLGRVTLDGFKQYAAADKDSEVIDQMPFDSLWRITGATISETEHSPNRIWYELNGKGYAHSSQIQPVRKRPNSSDTVVPEEGCLGEVTMPTVDAFSSMDEDRSVIYRFYYGATFWVQARLKNPDGSVWYQLLDDRYYQPFFLPAYNIRLVPQEELAPISPGVLPGDKQIVVDLATQTLTAYQEERVVFMSRISSGIRLEEGGFATPKGQYRTHFKRPCRHMANPPNEFGTGFDLPGVPWVSYFTSDGIALHGTYWHNDFGVPHSHGCINMTPRAAKWVYRWTTPTVPANEYFYSDGYGTRVIIQ